jgi:Icc-related predicted phosphoesterase
VNDQKKWINKKFREWTQSYPDIQFVVTPGNHDFFPIAHILFKDHGIDWGYGFSKNVHFLGDCGAEINGVKFYGTPWVPIISYSWAFEGEHDTLKKWFSKIPSDIDVLITHSPPRIPGSDVDRSIQTDSEHFGSGELTEAIIDKRPRFVFCGHIHTGRHGGVDFEGSRIYNVSRLDENYEIAYPPTWVEV